MPEPFVVAFVVGVTPGKWARVWADRMPQHPLVLRPLAQLDAIAALADGTANVALLRLPATDKRPFDDTHSAIVLYSELPVVVAAKEHAIEAADSVTLADLAGFMLIGGDATDDLDVRASDSAESVDSGWPAAIELAATNVGVVIVPQSVARANSRRDVIVRPVTDGAQTRIALVWLSERATPEVDEFVGIVRGRTANSSRGRDGEDSADGEATDAAAHTYNRGAGGGGSSGSGKTGGKKAGAGAKSGNGANAAPKRTGPRPPRKNQLKAYKKKPKRF